MDTQHGIMHPGASVMTQPPATHAHATLETPIGPFTLVASAQGLTHVQLAESPKLPARASANAPTTAASRHVAQATRALDDYFAGRRRAFDDLALAPTGSPFELTVWQALRTIPHGETRSYGQIAAQVGDPGAARAVGIANNRNPIGIIVPCHRVIGADGKLVGYGGGLERKAWLLAHEGARTMRLFDER